MIHAAEATSGTRRRLIEAASEVFIEHGFRAAKIRDIVNRANANLAAINYHFGGKEGLYAAVIEYNAALAIEDFWQRTSAPDAHTPEDQLEEFIRAFLRRLLDDNIQSRMGRLIAREMTEPTSAFNLVVEKFITPWHVALSKIVRAIVGQGVSDEIIRRCAMSIIGQCLYYQTARRVMGWLDSDFRYRPEDIERLVDHLTAFSLGGLQALATSRERGIR